jgi:hypothetical protein
MAAKSKVVTSVRGKIRRRGVWMMAGVSPSVYKQKSGRHINCIAGLECHKKEKEGKKEKRRISWRFFII